MNKKIIDYQIVSAQDSYGNISTYRIDILIKEGWYPQGGICSYNSSLGHNHLYQAMVKYE
jgi:hypothetical protein